MAELKAFLFFGILLLACYSEGRQFLGHGKYKNMNRIRLKNLCDVSSKLLLILDKFFPTESLFLGFLKEVLLYLSL